MASPSMSYASPADGHTPVGSPAPSQILLHRVASPNHLAQHQYVESPRSVPSSDHLFQYSAPQEQHLDYDHSQELYVNNDHLYDYNGNGPLHDQQFVQQQQLSPNGETTNLMFMPSVQIQPPTPMHPAFATHFHAQERSMTPFSDDGSEFTMESTPELNGNHLVDISASGYALPSSHYMALPRSHPLQGRNYYDSPVFDDEDYDSRSPSPNGIREQVKRPLNAFMLYRKAKQGEIPTSNHQSVSRIIGALWKNESADVKAHYNSLAQREREKHRLAYPGYKYSPKKRINKDKKVRRTMSQAAHAKRQEEEKEILKHLNKRSKSEGTLARPLPETLPPPKSKQNSVAPEERKKTPGPEGCPKIMPYRSHSAQPAPTAQDFSKFTSNPQQHFTDDINVPPAYVPSQFPEQYEYFQYSPAEYLSGDSAVDTPFSDTDSFIEFPPEHQVCSPELTAFDEEHIYGAAFAHKEEMEIFRLNSPFAGEGKAVFENPRVQNVFGQWSRESTVNPQDLLAQPDNA